MFTDCFFVCCGFSVLYLDTAENDVFNDAIKSHREIPIDESSASIVSDSKYKGNQSQSYMTGM